MFSLAYEKATLGFHIFCNSESETLFALVIPDLDLKSPSFIYLCCVKLMLYPFNLKMPHYFFTYLRIQVQYGYRQKILVFSIYIIFSNHFPQLHFGPHKNPCTFIAIYPKPTHKNFSIYWGDQWLLWLALHHFYKHRGWYYVTFTWGNYKHCFLIARGDAKFSPSKIQI